MTNLFEEVDEAIKRQNYQKADQLLQQLLWREPENPWIQFYLARLDEALGNLKSAEELYYQLLKNNSNPKLISLVRQSINRLAEIKQTERQKALSQGSKEIGVLVLETIPSNLKQNAAQKLAKIMQIDVYSARLQLPSRAWRLYRTATMGELQFYADSLKQAEIPSFCVSINAINQLKVYSVNYFQSVNSQATVIYQQKKGEQKSFSFDWSEVSQRVETLLPIFEKCVEMNIKHKLERKTKILDYAQFCDLHLPKRNCILRLCDQKYQFQKGIAFSPQQKSLDRQTTIRENWNYLIKFFQQNLPIISVWSDFNIFAQTALDYREMLNLINSHIDLLRREETPWDATFQLYSGLILVRNGLKID